MSEEDVQVKIKVDKEGDGAQQAKSELDALKKTADSADTSTSNLHFKLIGFRTILSSVGMMARGGAEAVSGFARALGGVVMILSNTAWGRLAMIAATVASIGVAIWQSFKPATAALDDTAAAAGRLQAKLPKDLAEPGLPNAIEFAKQLTDAFDKATAAAERTRKSMDELADANLALKLATIDKEVAAGGMTPEQGQQARIEARLSHEQEKISREKVSVKDKVARAQKQIDEAAESYTGAAAGAAQTEADIKASGHAPGFAPTPAELAAAKPGTPYDRQSILENNIRQKQLAEQKAAMAERLKTYDVVKEKNEPEIETGQAKLATLDVLSQASTTSASAQSLTVASTMAQKKDEQEAQAAAALAAYNATQEAEAEKRRKAQEKSAKETVQDRADKALDLQKAQEQSAKIQFSAAQHAAGDRTLSPSQRAQAKQDLSSAQSNFNREQSESVQAQAIAGKIRDTTDPAALQNLIRSIEALGANVTQALNQAAAAVNQVNAQVTTQASQLKNGGLRTQ